MLGNLLKIDSYYFRRLKTEYTHSANIFKGVGKTMIKLYKAGKAGKRTLFAV